MNLFQALFHFSNMTCSFFSSCILIGLLSVLPAPLLPGIKPLPPQRPSLLSPTPFSSLWWPAVFVSIIILTLNYVMLWKASLVYTKIQSPREQRFHLVFLWILNKYSSGFLINICKVEIKIRHSDYNKIK